MLNRLLTSAVFAGAAAGLAAAVLQLSFVQPVLLHAELYEGGDLVHFGRQSLVPVAQELDRLNPMRDILSVMFMMLTFTGYALIMVAGMSFAEERGASISGRTGIMWGLAGFFVFFLAPGFSLPAEVPGVAAADVPVRQIWWIATVASAAVAVWLIAFSNNRPLWAVAALLLLAPHVIGAPQPEVFTGPAPTEIGALFVTRATGTNFAAWLLLGCLAGYFWQRDAQRETAASHA